MQLLGWVIIGAKLHYFSFEKKRKNKNGKATMVLSVAFLFFSIM